MKKLLSLVLATMMLFSITAAFATTINMGTNASFPPYEFIGENGEVEGIDVDIAKAICDKLGYTLNVVDMEFDSLIPSLQSGKIDVAMAGMTVTEERATLVNFSDSYATGIQSVIVKNDSPITSVDDLFVEGNNYDIGVQLSTTGDIYSTGDLEDAGLAKIHRFPTGNEATQALVNGKIDAVIIDNEPAKAYVASLKGLKVLDTEYTIENYAAAINKDNAEFLAEFNGALKALIEDGTVKTIVEKYISSK